MAKPSFLPSNSTTLQRLFLEMPRSFSSDPQSFPIINFTVCVTSDDYADSTSNVSFIISDGVLTVNSLITYIFSESILLSEYTVNELVSYFSGKYGRYGIKAELSSTVQYYQGNISATTLLEGVYDIVKYAYGTTSYSFTEIDRFTSNNYSLLMTIALGLIDNERNMRSAIRQTDLRLSQNKWIDHWGRQLGISRQGNELYSDENYRNRIQAQITQQKSNNIALEYFIISATGRNASVLDGGRPMLLGGSATISGVNTAISGTPFPTVDGSGLTVTITVGIGGVISSVTIYTPGMGYKKGGSGTLTFTITGGTILASCNVNVANGVPYGTVSISSAGTGYSATTQAQTTVTGSTGLTTYDESYRIGPSTGAGSFVVYVSLYDTEWALPQPVYSALVTLVNKWKPAGIPFVIKSTGGTSAPVTVTVTTPTTPVVTGFTWLPSWYNPAVLNQVTWE